MTIKITDDDLVKGETYTIKAKGGVAQKGTYRGPDHYGDHSFDLHADPGSEVFQRFLVAKGRVSEFVIPSPDALDKTMDDLKKAVEVKTKHPAEDFVRAGYMCEPAANGGWVVQMKGGDYDRRPTMGPAAFTTWPDMMDWLRVGHEAVTPTVRDGIDAADPLAPYTTLQEQHRQLAIREGRKVDDVDGWIEWRGGTNPAQNNMVEARLRNGVRISGFADRLPGEWGNGRPMATERDIIAYRIISDLLR